MENSWHCPSHYVKMESMKKKIIPIVVVIVLVVLIALGMVAWRYYQEHFVPTKERAELTEYFQVTDEKGIIIIEDDKVRDGEAFMQGGKIYLSYSLVHDLNDRFYLDENEGLLLYCTDQSLISFDIHDCEDHYYVDHQPVATEYPVLLEEDGELSLALEFADLYLTQDIRYYEDPSRLVITTDFEPVTVQEAVRDTAIRIRGGIKSEILRDLPAGEVVKLLEEGEDWNKVSDNTGFTGYVEKKSLSEARTESLVSPKPEETYTHLLLDKKVCLLWDQVTNMDSNSKINGLLDRIAGVNVMSPTWYSLSDSEGGITDLGSQAYVDACHERGIQVWPLISNLEHPEADDNQVLSHTSLRRKVEDTVVQKVKELGADGINLDFESIEPEFGEDYVQFIRELSLKCAENNLILSVDTYVPMDYSKYYNRKEQGNFADYVVIMAYDEHYEGSDEGSVASLPYAENGVKNTIEEGVDPSQIVLGMPFYTRLWIETPKTEAPSEMEQASETYIPYNLTSQTLGMALQNQTVAAHNAVVSWIEELGQNFAVYIEDGITYKIWMEDKDSLEKKLEVVTENQIGGGAFWKSEFEIPEVWGLIAEKLG